VSPASGVGAYSDSTPLYSVLGSANTALGLGLIYSYLGDILIHFSFPLLLYPNSLLHPVLLLGPLTNYLFLRHMSGDKENEESQAHRYATTDPGKMSQFNQYRQDKNAVWPAFKEFANVWTWGVLGAGAGAVVIERAIRGLL